ncbi:phosphoribosyl-dephospho-CoA transferase MdcG domain-containing protein [Legionella sp. WA2024007413]
MNPKRHHLIYLQPNADFTIASFHEEKQMIEEQVRLWLVKGLPCIYTRQLVPQETVSLGVTLLLANKKHRVGLRVNPSFVRQQSPLPQLIKMDNFFCRYYGITELYRILELYLISDIAVYGSFLFQYLTEDSFVSPDSDLDILLNYQGYSLVALRELIDALTHKFNRVIDGEVRFPGFGDIPIRELLNLSAKKMLCKSLHRVRLLSRIELYEYYPML